MTRSCFLLAAATLVFNGTTIGSLAAFRAGPTTAESTPPHAALPAAFTVQRGADDGLFRLTGSVGRQPVSFIVDTGATTTVICAKDAARLGLSPAAGDQTSEIRTAAGSTTMVWKHLDRLDIAGSRIADLDVVVVPVGPDHSLLGQDVLSRFGSVTQSGGSMRIRPARS